ncbi:MAG: pantothenate kinase [Oscillatoriophycideae cyanobacterium NC_groundwater_1537_Pr4_S-0.65um_50_18]|nr:pantothenate kinase [Oscillatoriophycideae cyanobacterium NC_groundwater_1537_Pr4_S-0.65um_50_18]
MSEPSSKCSDESNVADTWLALMMGNSRLHWAKFVGHSLESTWDVPHAEKATIDRSPLLPLWVASVVPEQTQWQDSPNTHRIDLAQIPLLGLYPTLGVDRALAVWGAVQTRGAPVLVIDAGTALTFTGADAEARLVGGAILPGLQLQMRSLHEHTAALPLLTLPDILPPRWGVATAEAMQSGVLYTLLAGLHDFIADWLQRWPQSAIVITGGDRLLLLRTFQQRFPQMAVSLQLDAHLIFWGIRAFRMHNQMP